MAGRDRPRIDVKAVQEIEALGKKHGIELWSPQTTGSPELIGRFNLLGDLHVTADKIGAARLKQYAEINTSVNKWLDSLAPPTITKARAGELGVKAAKKGIRAAKDVRRKAAEKQYQEAMKVKGLDISGTINQIDEMLNVSAKGSAERKSLNKIKTMLTREGKGKPTKEIPNFTKQFQAKGTDPTSEAYKWAKDATKEQYEALKKEYASERVRLDELSKELAKLPRGPEAMKLAEAKSPRAFENSFKGEAIEAYEMIRELRPRDADKIAGIEKTLGMKLSDIPRKAVGKMSEDRLIVLDKVKKEINSMWKKDPKTAPQITEQRSINKILDSMLKKIDEEVPVYKEARRIFQEGVPKVEKLTKGKIGEIAKIEGEGAENVAKKIFSPSQSSPEIIAKAKPVIIKEGGQYAWNALLRTHVKQAFRDAVKTGTKNIGGQLRKRLFGDLDQKDILRAAMSKQQYKNFDDLMKIFERTALTAGKESTTATRQVALAQLEQEARGVLSKGIRAATRPLYTYQRIFGDFAIQLRSDRYKEALADLLLSGKAATQLKNMLQLKPGSQILLKRLSVFLTTLGGAAVRQRRVRSKYEDISPTTLITPRMIPGEPQGRQR